MKEDRGGERLSRRKNREQGMRFGNRKQQMKEGGMA
jgi:hypothetical protein